MNEQTVNSGDSGDSGAASFSDETIRRFLLCRLSEDERARFEERLLIDDELERRVRLAECELTDDYAFNRLSAEERDLLEKNFIVTEERRRKLEVSQALQRHFAPPATAKKNVAAIENKMAWHARLLGLFDFKRPALAFAFSLAALVLVIGVIWLVARNARDNGEPAIVKHAPDTEPKPQNSPQTIISPTPFTDVTPAPNPSPKTTPPTPETSSTPRAALATFVLLPGAIRDGGQMSRVTPPQGGRDIVRLQLSLEAVEPGTYRAELLTAEDQPITAARKLRAVGAHGQARVVFDVPARLLKAGDYQVKLSRNVAGGSTEDVARYYFRALP